MTDISALIKSTLTGIGVPSAFQRYPPGNLPTEYVTFTGYHTAPELEAGDNELLTARLIQVNVWSKKNYDVLVKNIRDALESVGFERTFEYDVPHQDGDSHYNKVLRFAFFDEY